MTRFKRYWYILVIAVVGILLLSGLAVARSITTMGDTLGQVDATTEPTYPITPSQKGRKAWASGNPSAVLPGPRDTGTPIAHLYAGFAMTLTGQIVKKGATTWYRVMWKNYLTAVQGWVSNAGLTFTHPATGTPERADLGALSSHLAADAQSQGGNVGVSIYAPDLNRYYGTNDGQGFEMASTFKVPILLTLLRQHEDAGQPLSTDDQSLATAMIEASDNDAATTLYEEIGYNTGVSRLMGALSIAGLMVNTQAFGSSTVTPYAMTQLLAALNAGHILNAGDRQFALNLMSNIDSDEQFGIGTAAPQGAQFAMKDGWLQDDDGSWVDDSVGIVTVNGHTAIISVYSQNSDSEDDGWKIVNALCSDIMTTMTKG